MRQFTHGDSFCKGRTPFVAECHTFRQRSAAWCAGAALGPLVQIRGGHGVLAGADLAAM
jgi:hypothetical protein